MDKKKKIIGGILLAIIVIGIIVIAVKGFNVGLSLRPHDTFKFVFEQKYNLNDVKSVCKEVFNGKDFRIRGVEVFDDAVYIEASTITAEEQSALAQKLEALYKVGNTTKEDLDESTESIQETTDVVVENEKKYEFFNDSNIRLRDEIKPYILPSCISALIVLVYVAIRFKKLEDGNVHITLIKIILESLILILTILSLIAIFRIPLEKITFSMLIIVEIIYLIIKFACMENELKK